MFMLSLYVLIVMCLFVGVLVACSNTEVSLNNNPVTGMVSRFVVGFVGTPFFIVGAMLFLAFLPVILIATLIVYVLRGHDA